MIKFEQANEHHLPDFVAMLTNDPLGSTRQDASLPLGGGWKRGMAEML
jgi:hypothetical protein